VINLHRGGARHQRILNRREVSGLYLDSIHLPTRTQ
jgi:hypothetical protein